MTAPDDHDPMLTRALGIWAEAAVPSLPDDFTASVMAEAMSQQAATAWAETAVPSLPDDFTASVMAGVATQRAAAVWAETAVPELPDDFAAKVAAKAAARPKLKALDGGSGGASPAPAQRWWRWPAVAVAAAALLALLTSRAPTTVEPTGPVARRVDGEAPRSPTPEASNPVAVALAEVTRVEVLGAQSVAVLSIQGEGGASGSPVVWITDKAEDAPAGDLETRVQ